MKRIETSRIAALVALAALVAIGCALKSPEEKVAQLRSYYTARPVGFFVKAQPIEAPPGNEEGADGVEAGDADGEEIMEAEPVPIRQTVHLDILLQHDSPEKLPGVTLDLIMVDASQAEKHRWLVWVDTAKLPKATGTQFTHLIEDIDYEEGDAFSVEVRHPIPPEERGDYREFAVAGE